MKKTNSHIENKRRAAPTAVGPGYRRPKENPRQAAKRTEEALRESEQRYRELVEDINEVIYEVDTSGRITYISPVVEEVSGYSQAEVIGRPFVEFVPADEVPTRMDNFRDGLSGRPIPTEFSLVSKSGEIRWIHTFGRVIREGDHITGFRGVLTDITERRQAEEVLRESQERFRSAFEHAAIGMALVRPDGHLLRVNPSFCRMLGYSEEELMSTTWRAITHPDDLGIGDDHIRRMLSGEIDSGQFEKRYCHKLGHEVWGLLSFSLVRDVDGTPLYFIAQIQDITERRRAEEALRESEERYRDLYDGAPVAYFAIGKDGRIAKANRRASELLGYSLDDLSGRPILDLYSDTPAGKDKAKRVIERFRRGRETHDEEMEMRRADGSPVWVSLTVRIVRDAGGQPVETRSMVLDITERKRAEEALRMAQEELESGAEIQAQGADTYGFSLRELTVLNLVASGKTDKEIGTTLGISARTVQKHVEKLCKRMGASTRTEASVRALREGLIG